MQFAEGVQYCSPENSLVCERFRFRRMMKLYLIHTHLKKPFLRSSAGVRESARDSRAGKNVSAPTIKIVETSKPANRPPVTGNVPADSGTVFFLARLPAMASIGIIMKNRPSSCAAAVVVLYHIVFAFRPRERRAVVSGRRSVGVKDLRQSVRPGIANARGAIRLDDGDRRKRKNREASRSARRASPSSRHRIRFSCRGIPAFAPPSARR